MDEAKHRAAMNALTDLIRSELDSDSRVKFAVVRRLTVMAQRLANEMHPRPEDIDPEDDEDADYGIGPNIIGPRRARRHANVIGFDGDQNQMVREMMAMFGPLFTNLQNQNEAQRRVSTARELNELTRVRDRLQAECPDNIVRRIDEIVASIDQEGEQDELPLVPAVDVRGHQAEPIGQVFDLGDPQRALPHGEERHGGADQTGDEAGHAENCLGGE